MKNNKGYSLVEIMIVLAILAVLATVGITGLGYIWGTNVRSCANELKTAIGKTRITTMGKDEATIRIYQDSTDGAYYKQEIVDGVGERPIKVGKAILTLTYTMVDGTGTLIGTGTISGSDELAIAFDRSSGAQREATAGAGMCSEIDVSFGSRHSIITLVPATGKVHIN